MVGERRPVVLRNGTVLTMDGQRRVAAASDVLAALNPRGVLRRGYALLQFATDALPVFSVAQIEDGTRVVATLDDGSFRATVESHAARNSRQALETR